MARIEMTGVSVDFPIYHVNRWSLKHTVLAAVTGRHAAQRFGTDASQRVVVRALRDIDFTLDRGDRLGLVGVNGAGKTTLLRVLAGIYEPVQGSVRVMGDISALIDPTLGMNAELTGRENIMLRGLTSRMSPDAIARLEADVREFSELGDFIDLPVRFYSSGMVVRLGFALATAIQPEVLLMDEWLLAGDATFIEKARIRLEGMVRGADILVLSSHVPTIIAQWCTRVIRLEQGRIVDDGPTREVLERYLGYALPEIPAEAQPPAMMPIADPA
jgi:lipopolysaccharide transport system ATP-binding protein